MKPKSQINDQPTLIGLTVYLVGGAVRDEILGLPINERDWVVVGATPSQLLALGFTQVGKDFPVFLHPISHEEYALARTERKVASGYHGFNIDGAPSVTLEQDLARRDLTINAIAKDMDGNLIDPFLGIEDLKQKKLRHITEAFREDPVRILRLARFWARFHYLGFSICEQTIDFCKMMVQAGEVAALVPERVWQEWQKALTEKNPECFWQLLVDINALAIISQPFAEFVDSIGLSTLQRRCEKFTDALTTDERLALLCYDMPPTQFQQFSQQLKLSKQTTVTVTAFIKTMLYYQRAQIDAKTVLTFFHEIDAFRKTQRAHIIMKLCHFTGIAKPAWYNKWQQALEACLAVDSSPLVAENLQGLAFAKQLAELRQQAIAKVFS